MSQADSDIQQLECARCHTAARGPLLDEALPKIGWRNLAGKWWCSACVAWARAILAGTPDANLGRS